MGVRGVRGVAGVLGVARRARSSTAPRLASRPCCRSPKCRATHTLSRARASCRSVACASPHLRCTSRAAAATTRYAAGVRSRGRACDPRPALSAGAVMHPKRKEYSALLRRKSSICRALFERKTWSHVKWVCCKWIGDHAMRAAQALHDRYAGAEFVAPGHRLIVHRPRLVVPRAHVAQLARRPVTDALGPTHHPTLDDRSIFLFADTVVRVARMDGIRSLATLPVERTGA